MAQNLEFVVTGVEHKAKDVVNAETGAITKKAYTMVNIAEVEEINGMLLPSNELKNVYSDVVLDVKVGDKVLLNVTLTKYSRKGPDGKYSNVQSFRINAIVKK